jgi:hypothetical protein
MCCRQTYLFAAYFCDRGCSRSREDLPSYRVMHDALLKEDKMEGLLAYKLKSDSPDVFSGSSIYIVSVKWLQTSCKLNGVNRAVCC